MENDFRENYIREQKEQSAARRARLEKIGMAQDEEKTAPRTGAANAAPRRRPVPVKPADSAAPADNTDESADFSFDALPRRSAGTGAQSARNDAFAYSDPYSAQQYADQYTSPAQRPAQRRPETAYTPTGDRRANGAQQYSRPQQSAARPAATQNRAPQQSGARPAGGAQYNRPHNGAQQRNGAPANGYDTAQNPGAQRPAQRPNGTAASQRPARPQGARPQNGAPAYANRRSAQGGEPFKKNLSESESKAMMFALTGQARQPDNGGRVDVVDTGAARKKAPQQKPLNFRSSKRGGGKSVGRYIGRGMFVVLTALLMVIVTVYSALLCVAYGPSETVRNLLVNSAMQASATKWVPYLVLSKDKVSAILADSEKVVEDVVSIDDYGDDNKVITEDEWANAKDGMIFETVNGSTYKAYVLLVKDPTRVFVGTSTDDFSNATAGVNIFQAADRYGAVACINGGEFLDNGGHGSGYAPLGLTFSMGKCVFDDGSKKTFMGFTADNKFVVREGMTQKEATELGIRDAVSFQTGNTLIERNGDDLKFYYQDGNTGTSQRTAIGQRDDGTVIMIVTDGRTASSLGATHNDMIDLMVSYGAVSAGMLDGGSSAMMFYRDYYDKYDIDKSTLDEYQLQGLVNNYKAFTNPRRIPTFFMVKPEA